MPTGPKATLVSAGRKRLSQRIRETDVLLRAWHSIRRNGETSSSKKTREEVRSFGAELPRRLRRIQERLRKDYQFSPALGATPQKAKGNGKRPLVIAPLEDRIVQRAILDLLQDAKDVPAIQKVVSTPTSIGGIPGRGTDYAIAMIEAAYRVNEAHFIAGSDISDFFTKIDQREVCEFVREAVEDDAFSEFFKRALHVELANADQLHPDELKLFPTDEIGVAQGCPLSALAGNIALRDFDEQMNGRGITCLRYIDDFVLLGDRRASVEKAFKNASAILASKGMAIYQRGDGSGKSFFGRIEDGPEFLGYRLLPGVYPPSKANQDKLVASIRQEIEEGRSHILRVLSGHARGQPLQYFAQTLNVIDRLLRAWSGSFRASRCKRTAESVDKRVDELISGFIGFYRDRTEGRSITEKRRALGVHVLGDDITSRLQQAASKAV